MWRRRIALTLGFTPVLFLGAPLASTSCTGGSNNDGGMDANADAGNGPCQNGTIQLIDCEPDEAGVVVERFTDEACDGLDTAEMRAPVMHDDSQAPAVDLPTEGQTVAGSAPFTFTWHDTGFTYRAMPAPATRMFTWRDDLTRWTRLLPAADAHCSPFGGLGYAITFSASNGQAILRAETASRSYTPTSDAWMRLRAAQGTITMNVEIARFANNIVTEGPVDDATPRHFSIGP
jgi:hypothetical protein